MRDATGAILDSVGYGDTTNAFVEAHATTAPPATAAPGSSSIRAAGRPRHERQRGRLLGQRDAHAGRRQPLATIGRAARRACRPPITPKGHARRQRPHRYWACGVIQVLAWRITNCGNCGDWSHRSTHPRTPALPRAHAHRLRSWPDERARSCGSRMRPTERAQHVGTRDARIHCGNEPRARAAAQPAGGSIPRWPRPMPVGNDGLSGLPTPPPAIRPPEAAPGAPPGACACPGPGAPAARARGGPRPGRLPRSCSGPRAAPGRARAPRDGLRSSSLPRP